MHARSPAAPPRIPAATPTESSSSPHWASCSAISAPARCTHCANVSIPSTASPSRGQRSRAAVADPLVAGAGHLDQVRRHRAARGQPRRRRRAGAEHACCRARAATGDCGHRSSAVGLFGAALFFGDGFITPAISVLSAMEGLTVATPQLEHFVVPGAVLILTALFLVQRRGTGAMGRLFGPVTLVWFVDARAARPALDRHQARRGVRDQSAVRRALLHRQRRRRFRHARLGVSRRDRRRSAVCRHGPLRPLPDPPRLVHDRACRRWC